jgi:enediyne biosynthesis protein E5
MDARLFQIVFLGGFLVVGVLVRDFTVNATQIALVFASSLATQRFWIDRLKLAHVGYLSAIVTSFGISILVRADSLWVHPLLAAIAISSKFIFRIDHNHVFNPANLAAVLAAYVLPGAWLSPGQWGQSWMLAAWFLGLGLIVTQRAKRIDIGVVFLISFATLLTVRVFVLGQNPWIIWHQMQNGVLLLFAFFMISDPMTTPRHAIVRIGYAMTVALLAFCWQFGAFKPNGPILALACLSLMVPWLNRRFPAQAFQWQSATCKPTSTPVPLQLQSNLKPNVALVSD